ncbi:serine carboxypeptidase-like 51 [Phalaenopsis equestris]|uniref:serine carboxypeptidase-like 51 n=1 Tax=Phalaenopsis equestris TaxID=78828 RepID=UPI0009E57590|nr:serine carboxypeptidase-like 51 [Phalaenopsis equestris]
MKQLNLCLLCLLLCFPLFHGRSPRTSANSGGTRDGLETWGYVEVRPKAHMFWWLYLSPNAVQNGSTPWPTVLWLQGGPGASGVGMGNFEEIGPLDTNLKPRNSTWLQNANLLFVDNPVGTGYSYVEDSKSYVTTDEEAATDLTILLKNLYEDNHMLQNSPLYAVAESYGGKFAVTLALSLSKAIKAGELKLNFSGIALGNSWISPEDFVLSWGPLLRDVSRLDVNGEAQSNKLAKKIQEQITNGQYSAATGTWTELEREITVQSNYVNFYNFLLDDSETIAASTSEASVKKVIGKYAKKVRSSKPSSAASLADLMDGVIRDKLKIIPKNVSWDEQSSYVFGSLVNEFMRPRIKEVDELLSMGVDVTIYNGQVDLICATKGVEAWVQKLKWEGLQNFSNAERSPLYCENEGVTAAFKKSYKNLHFYWILGAGHFVPVEKPCMALKMIGEITQSPAKSSP